MFGYLEVELLVPVVIELYCLTSMTNFRSAHYYWLFLSTYNYSIVCVHITYSGFLKCSEIHIFFLHVLYCTESANDIKYFCSEFVDL